MSRTFVQPGNAIDAVAPAGGVTAGVPVLLGAIFGIPEVTAAEGETFALTVVGVHDLPAVGPIDAFAAVYFDSAAGKITAANSGTIGPVGAALLAVGVAGTTCRTRLNGTAVPA